MSNPRQRFALTIIALSGNAEHGVALFPNLLYYCVRDLGHFTPRTLRSIIHWHREHPIRCRKWHGTIQKKMQIALIHFPPITFALQPLK